jgi:hypothetical protein
MGGPRRQPRPACGGRGRSRRPAGVSPTRQSPQQEYCSSQAAGARWSDGVRVTSVPCMPPHGCASVASVCGFAHERRWASSATRCVAPVARGLQVKPAQGLAEWCCLCRVSAPKGGVNRTPYASSPEACDERMGRAAAATLTHGERRRAAGASPKCASLTPFAARHCSPTQVVVCHTRQTRPPSADRGHDRSLGQNRRAPAPSGFSFAPSAFSSTVTAEGFNLHSSEDRPFTRNAQTSSDLGARADRQSGAPLQGVAGCLERGARHDACNDHDMGRRAAGSRRRSRPVPVVRWRGSRVLHV